MQGQYVGAVPNMFTDEDNLIIDMGAFRYVVPWRVALQGLDKCNALAAQFRTENVIPIRIAYEGRANKH